MLFFSEDENSSEIESQNESIIKNSNKSDCSSDEGEHEELELRKQLKTELNELVFYKIEMPSASSNKKIISCIERIIEIINIITKKNNNPEQKENSYFNNENKQEEIKRYKFKDLNIYEVFLLYNYLLFIF